jgi:hypothetical protein
MLALVAHVSGHHEQALAHERSIDPREHRLLLSGRGNASARDEHLRRLASPVVDAPFIMWSDHYMIARGRVSSHTGLNLFVDSGLVMGTAEKGQAALLASQTTLDGWGVARSFAEALADLPGTLALGPICRERMTAISVPDKIWRDFGTWGGIQVDALISWGFLKHATWTIDFDRYVYCFSEDIKDWQHP